MATFLKLLIALSTISYTLAECLNACSAHGTCGAFDMCTCYKNFMANDCSQRICQFGIAHSDTAKGDLDSSGSIDPTGVLVVKKDAVYPHGTYEQYPDLADSVGTILDNTGHGYMECSNKGLCDRTTGSCVCFDGYSGSACQRTACPSTSAGECSGHGLCQTIEKIADLDAHNIYALWDKKAMFGCVCDPGFAGPDCSEKVCKFGVDPLYANGPQTIRYTNVTYEIYTTAAAVVTGNYSLIFTDHLGKTWNTIPIDIAADCDTVTNALEALPNKAIPADSVLCYQHPAYTATNVPIYNANIIMATKFTLAFSGNPGVLPELRINKYNDGVRATLYTNEATPTLAWHIYSNGYTGEDIDFVPDLCEGVLITITDTNANAHVVSGLTSAEEFLLKKCLGDNNADMTDNVDVANWDWGTVHQPHLIKLVDATQDVSFAAHADDDDDEAIDYPKSKLCASQNSYINSHYATGWCANRNPAGFYAALYYDGTTFKFITKPGTDYDATTEFHVFTTNGSLKKISNFTAYSYESTATTSEKITAYHSNILEYANITAAANVGGYIGRSDIACDTESTKDCLNKNDYVMFLNSDLSVTNHNPIYPNIYQIQRVGVDAKSLRNQAEAKRRKIVLNNGVNTDYASNYAADIFKFTPPMNGYHYTSECAGRGLCDTSSGLCQCFAGYTGDDCSVQNALST